MKKSSLEDRDFSLWMLLSEVTDGIRKARKKELMAHSVLPGHSPLLQAVQDAGSRATPSEIARRLFRRPHTISQLLNRMEKKGLVKKSKDLKRKNMVRVTLTEKGQQAYYRSTKRESIYRIMSSLSEEQRQQLRSCLQMLHDKVWKEPGIEYTPPFS